MRTILTTLAAAAACMLPSLLGACAGDGGDGVLSIDATGTVVGTAYLDRNGNDALDAVLDAAVDGLALRLVPHVHGSPTATATTGEAGRFELVDVPVGRYRLRVDETTVPDSIRLVVVDSPVVTVGRNDTIVATVRFSYPRVSVADARRLEPGAKVFVQGIALNGWATFGDSTVHLGGDSVALRARRVEPADLGTADSVRVLGTRGTADGQPILDHAVAFDLGGAVPPVPERLSTAVAATADGGRSDAALIEIVDARIDEVVTLVSGDVRFTVDDGSGSLHVVFDRDGDFLFLPDRPLVGSNLDAIGVLVPDGRGDWLLKPRTGEDVTIDDPA